MSDELVDFVNCTDKPSMYDPFANAGNGNKYYKMGIDDGGSDIPFDHSVLESPAFETTADLRSGEIYEIRTEVSRTGTNANQKGNFDIELVSTDPGSTYEASLNEWVENPRGGDFEAPVFSTFDRAVKWSTAGEGGNTIATSNFFMMPDLPQESAFDYLNDEDENATLTLPGHSALRVRIGPANSDNDFSLGALSSTTWQLVSWSPPGGSDDYEPSAYFTYAHHRSIGTDCENIGDMDLGILSHDPIQRNFGIGLPWSMMINVYKNVYGDVFDEENDLFLPHTGGMFNFWWHSRNDAPLYCLEVENVNWLNTPTMLDAGTKLEKVEIWRYAKAPMVLSAVEHRIFNGECSYLGSDGDRLLSTQVLEYGEVEVALLRPLSAPLSYPEVDDFPKEVVVLTAIKKKPENPSLDPALDASLEPEDEWPTTRFSYAAVDEFFSTANDLAYDCDSDITAPYGNFITGVEPFLSEGALLDRIVDPMGGITSIVYNDPRDRDLRELTILEWSAVGASPIQGSTTSTRCDDIYALNPPTFSITPTVKELQRSDEEGETERVWSYEYSNKVYKPRQPKLGEYFKLETHSPALGQYGYLNVEVTGPDLDGYRNKSVHTFHGAMFYHTASTYIDGFGTPFTLVLPTPDPILPSTEQETEDFLLFGKLKKTEQKNDAGTLLDKVEYFYDVQLAHESAIDRPYSDPLELGGHTCTYFDYFDGFVPPEVPDESQPNLSFSVFNNLIHKNSPWQTPAFLDLFYRTMDAHYEIDDDDMPTIFRNSYFVKKTREEHTTYDPAGCALASTTPIILPAYPDSPGPLVNPGGTGTSNANSDANASLLISQLNSGGVTSATKADLLAETPLSEAVIQKAIEKATTAQAADLREVLQAEATMTNLRLNQLILKPDATDPEKFMVILAAQPYLADTTQLVVLSSEFTPEEKRDALLTQEHLSNSVLAAMLHGPLALPGQHAYEVLLAQPDLPFDVLVDVVETGTLSDAMKADILIRQSGLGEDVFVALIGQAATMDEDAIEDILVHCRTYPADDELIALLEEVPELSESVLRNVLLASPRTPSGTLKDFILTGYPSAEVPGWASVWMEVLSYCSNACEQENLAIKTVTDYKYYEADETGMTSAEGYKRLMGLESVGSFQLKWEPSWQMYSKKTWTPQYPDAYSKDEYFYYQDLRNRYDRTWQVWQYEESDPTVNIEVVDEALEENGVEIWTVYKGSEYQVPAIEAIERLKDTDFTSVPFEHRITTKNNSSTDPIVRSEYAYFWSRWPAVPDPEHMTHEVEVDPDDDCPEDWVWPSGSTNTEGGGPTVLSAFRLPAVGYYNWLQHLDDVPPGFVMARDEDWNVLVVPIEQWVGDEPGYTELYTNQEDDGNGGYKYLVVADLLKHAFQLRWSAEQADEQVTAEYTASSWPKEEMPILQFALVEGDEETADEWRPLLPFQANTMQTVHERNGFHQVQLTENERGLLTRYNYEKVIAHWYKDEDENEPCDNYQTTEWNHPGLPTSVTVGAALSGEAELVNALTSEYSYNTDMSVATVTDPNGLELSYAYDIYGRMREGFRNGVSLGTNSYSYWNNTTDNDDDDWFDRTKENFVESMVYNRISDQTAVRARTYADPLGRSINSISYVVNDFTSPQQPEAMVSAGKTTYDSWGRALETFKPYAFEDGGGPFDFELTSDVLSNTPDMHGSAQFEMDQRGRPLFQSKPGEDITTGHRLKYRYQYLDCPAFACHLGLSAGELEMLAPNDPFDHIWLMTEVEDEDGNISRNYNNALGQKVATQGFIDGITDAVTLFLYDDQGNVRLVINPEKQYTSYKYNLLGWMYQKETVDGGITKYMFDQSGNVVLEQDAEGALGEEDPISSTTLAYYRKYEYDIFNRLIAQDRVRPVHRTGVCANYDLGTVMTCPTFPMAYGNVSINAEITGVPTLLVDGVNDYFYSQFSSASTISSLAHASVAVVESSLGGPDIGFRDVHVLDLVGQPLHEKAWFYDPSSNNNSVGGIPTANFYSDIFDLLQEGRGGLKGKLSHTISWPHRVWDSNFFLDQNQEWNFDIEQLPVHYDFLSYNDEGQVAWQLQQFNHNGINNHSLGNLTRIDYPAYDLRGNLLTENVDVNSDFLLDMQYHYVYDDRARLKEVYANFDDSQEEGNLLASYQYDDALGYLTGTTYSTPCSGGSSQQVDQIEYAHDIRDRLTSIGSQFFDHSLYYDDASPAANNGVDAVTGHFWNGRINASHSIYDLVVAGNDPGNFNEPTTYGYNYDGIGRLLLADGVQGDAVVNFPLDGSYVGDERYTFDRIGNLTSLRRIVLDETNSVVKHAWDYDYEPGTNRFTGAVAQVGSSAVDRSYTYDALGNLLTDDFRNIEATINGRANLPFSLFQGSGTRQHYLYNAADMRIHKMEASRGSGISSEFYLRDMLGREIGVLDMNGADCNRGDDLGGTSEESNAMVGDWRWYVHGLARFAHLTPICEQKPLLYTTDWGRQDQAEQEATFSSLRDLLETMNAEPGGLQYPFTIHYLELMTGGFVYMTTTELSDAVGLDAAFDDNGVTDVVVTSSSFQFEVQRAGESSTIFISAEEIIGLGASQTRGGSTVWAYTFMADPTLPPVTYYEHDHLGNTRVTYTPVADCGLGGPPYTEYQLQQVADYYPYGKVLREFVNAGGPEKYLTTHHERDQETGLDYRGARYYDSDVARFLSVDPKATKFAEWSSYSYVLGNPVTLVDPDGKEPREGNTVLAVNLDWSYLTRVNDRESKFRTYDSNLNSTASDYFTWNTMLGARSPKSVHWAQKSLLDGKKYIENLLGTKKTAARNGMEWKMASKSSTGYDYVESSETDLVARNVRNLNEQLGTLSGFENVVTHKLSLSVDEEGNSVATKEEWWTYRARTNEHGVCVVEYEHLSLDLVTPGASMERSNWQQAEVGIYTPEQKNP
ncbi:MAG: RHS repeat-associated core domain-containing protein [Flavobacteriales bacterium]